MMELNALAQEPDDADAVEIDLEKAFNRERPYRPNDIIVPANTRWPAVSYLVKGVALETVSEGGDRQIVAVRTAGDLFGFETIHLPPQPHAVIAKTHCLVRSASGRSIRRLAKHVTLYELLELRAAVEWASARAQNLRLRLPSHRAIAHLICELSLRLGAAGGEAMERFPLTQTEIGEATGCSLAQVNRALTILRDQGLIGLEWPLAITNWTGLCRIAEFDGGYLYLIDPKAKPAFQVDPRL